MDIAALRRRQEHATFSERESLADTFIGRLDESERRALIAELAHDKLAVLLGVIEILGRSGDVAMTAPYLAHAHARPGDDRVFALRALCRLARPGDEILRTAALFFADNPIPSPRCKHKPCLRLWSLVMPGFREVGGDAAACSSQQKGIGYAGWS